MKFYRHFMNRWMQKTESLTDEQYRVYHVILNLIYLSDGPIVPNHKGIAGRCNMKLSRFERVLGDLISMNKIITRGEGPALRLSNRTAEKEIASHAKQTSGLSRKTSSHEVDLESTGGEPTVDRVKAARKPLKLKNVDSSTNARNGLISSKDSRGLFPLEDSQSSGVSESKGSTRFDEFWTAYPHKVGKGAARISFERAIKKVDLETMIAAVRRYIETKPEDRAYCNPTTWLNQERWTDAPADNGGQKNGSLTDAWKRVSGSPGPSETSSRRDATLYLIPPRSMGRA